MTAAVTHSFIALIFRPGLPRTPKAANVCCVPGTWAHIRLHTRPDNGTAVPSALHDKSSGIATDGTLRREGATYTSALSIIRHMPIIFALWHVDDAAREFCVWGPWWIFLTCLKHIDTSSISEASRSWTLLRCATIFYSCRWKQEKLLLTID